MSDPVEVHPLDRNYAELAERLAREIAEQLASLALVRLEIDPALPRVTVERWPREES